MTIDGTYKVKVHTPVGVQDGEMTLKAEGASLSGTLVNPLGTTEFSGGTVTGDAIAFDTRIPTPIGRLKAHVSGTVSGDQFSGKAKLPLGSAQIEGAKLA
ncbi:hypothetical protein [Acidimangrovimonas pyrenivorans]|uniref:Uncharacterized protein n=1 Tax=Acidimangrovimonas pyrenivorans TaxID=2030798 RepID=A0ABV7ADS6_9RHOB